MNLESGINSLDLFTELSLSGLVFAASFFFVLVWAIFRIEGYRSIAVLCWTTLIFILASAASKIVYLNLGSLPLGFEFYRIKELDATAFLCVIPYFLASTGGKAPDGLRRFNRGLAYAGLAATLTFIGVAYAAPQLFLHDPMLTDNGTIESLTGTVYILSQALLILTVLYAMILLSLDFFRWGSYRQTWSVQIGFLISIYFDLSALSKTLFGFYIDPLSDLRFSRISIGFLCLTVFLSYGFFRLFIRQAKEVNESRNALEESRSQLHAMLYTDGLTGLSNRRCFISDLNNEIASGREVGVILMDLDNFMEFNECFGDDSGDEILRAVSQALAGTLTANDTLYRMGGDEFSVLVREGHDVKGLTALAELIRALSDRGFRIGDKMHSFGTAIALAQIPRDGETSEIVLSNAYAALHEAKSQNTICAYSDSLKKDSLARIMTVQHLREDLREGFFHMVYQPIHDRSGKVSSAEALLRWNPAAGVIPVGPDYFIPLLESSGLMPEMGELIIRLVLRDLERHLSAAADFPVISINLSPHQLKIDGLGKNLAETFSAAGIALERLQFEVTESAFLDHAGVSVANLSYLRSRGSKIAMDDFGTGYSNLGYLRNLPIDKIKVDQSFMRSVPGDIAAEGLLTALSDIGRSFGMKLVAEGVENKGQLGFLQDRGYDEYQGYLFSQPLPCNDFIRYIEDL